MTSKYLGKLARTEGPGKHLILVDHKPEDESPASPAYGAFVRIKATDDLDLIGIITSVQAVDTSKGHYDDWYPDHPDLMNVFDREVVDRPTLAIVNVVGTYNGEPTHMFSGIHPKLGAEAYLMDKDDIRQFHIIDDKPSVAYYQRLIVHRDITVDILTLLLDQLRASLPEAAEMLDVLEYELTTARYMQ